MIFVHKHEHLIRFILSHVYLWQKILVRTCLVSHLTRVHVVLKVVRVQVVHLHIIRSIHLLFKFALILHFYIPLFGFFSLTIQPQCFLFSLAKLRGWLLQA
jgi:hypothetical protein